MPKTHLNIFLDWDIAKFTKVFAAENRMPVAEMTTLYLLSLKRRSEDEYMEKILAHPASIRRWKMPRPNRAPKPLNGIHTIRSSKTA